MYGCLSIMVLGWDVAVAKGAEPGIRKELSVKCDIALL